MKLKKGILSVALVALIIFILGLVTEVKADTETYYLGLPEYRSSGYKYKARNIIIWKIASYPAITEGVDLRDAVEYGNLVPDYSKTFYCIKAGPGFGSTELNTGEFNGGRIIRKYDKKFDLKNTSTIPAPYNDSSIIPTGDNYKALIWVLEHAWIPEYESIEDFKSRINSENVRINKLTADDIEAIQQRAIWYFTNSDNETFHSETGELALRTKANDNPYSKDEYGFTALSGMYNDDGEDRAEQADNLFDYFVYGWENNNRPEPSSNKKNNNINYLVSLTETSSSQVELQGNYYYLGPYSISTNLKEYTLETYLKDGNNSITNYTILDTDKNAVTGIDKVITNSTSESETNNGQFYIRVPKESYAPTLEFGVTIKGEETSIEYWSVNAQSVNALAIDQPVASVNKTPYNETKKLTISGTIDEQMDLSLRKFITTVLPKGVEPGKAITYKTPRVDTSKLNTTDRNGNLITTADYIHPKDPVGVSVGDEVIYTIRVYNEGEIDGYVTEITDHLPAQLEFIVNDSFNIERGWKLDSTDPTNRTIKTDITSPNTQYSETRDRLFSSRTTTEDKVLLKAYDGGETLDYIDVQIKCKVKEVTNKDLTITNIADITGFTDSEGNIVRDRDSSAKNVVLPTTDYEWSEYIANSGKTVLNDQNWFYKGQEDDDDFDKLMLKEFDLALRKYITKINDEAPAVSREPKVDLTDLKSGSSTTATYNHPKDPLYVQNSDIVEYTIRIYNEGDISGYANLIKDDIPEGLEFLPDHETNTEYDWKMLDKDGNETNDVTKAVSIVTDALSREKETDSNKTLLIGFDRNTMTKLDSKFVKVAFKVIAPATYTEIITNKAQISDDSDEYGNEVTDRDSTPDIWIEGEDDQDVEHLKLRYFDLALRKFITGVNDKEVTNRYPVFKIKNGKYVYEHTKEPVDVLNNDIVIYTIRVYNEGTMAGYAEEIKDDIPDGLEFLPDHEINKNVWKMLDKDGNETNDVTKVVSVATDALSKAKSHYYGLINPDTTTNTRTNSNLLKEFNPDTMTEPDHLDIQIAFRVTEPNTSDRIIINHAQISDDADENGKEVEDIDSIPDEWNEGEDDQDIEKIKVKYFDLALRKWVTQAIVIENGVEKVTETGHKAEDDPEEVVKVEIEKSKLNKVVVKFNYSIRITNEGEIAGYATEISDYIPEGLEFIASDNPDWREVDGKIVTNKLANTLLQPGDTAEVQVLLTWINDADNMGLKINVAEISEDKNDSNTPDIDSVPNNKKPGEDDIDDAPVILATKTGGITDNPYIMVTIGSLSIITTGAILIKKFILK